MDRRASSATRRRLLGVMGLGLVGLLVFLSGAAYAQVFTPVVFATVDADRTGLLLDPKSDVTVRGVNVGEVREITPGAGRARILIALEPDRVEAIPGNVTAAILAPTVFGPKFIDLQMPERPEASLQEGAVIAAVQNTTEINEVFDGLMSLLTSIDPVKLNVTLGALSTALQGRGDDLGRYLAELNDYLVRFNPTLPLVQEDLQRGADVANIYADAAPDILRIASNASVLSRTLQDKRPELTALFLSFTRLGTEGTAFLQEVRPPLQSAVTVLRPTTGLLAEYSVTFPCLFAGVRTMGDSLSLAAGGGPLPGIGIFASVLPAQSGYQNPADLPLVGARDAPNCRSNPLPPNGGNPPVPLTRVNDGVTTIDFDRSGGVGPAGPTELAESLFGPDILPLLGDAAGVPDLLPGAGAADLPGAGAADLPDAAPDLLPDAVPDLLPGGDG